jgi:cation:H+ antiporter
VAIRTVFLHDAVGVPVPASEHDSSASRLTLRQAVVRYALLAAVVLVCGVRLPYAAQQVAVQMDWNMTFVGTTFVALTTSLPEMVVTLTAVRIGALDMAVGNIFGSNLFNILILAIDDLLYRPGPIFAHVSAAHAFSAITAMTMTGVAIVGLLYRPKTRALGAVGWGGLFMLSLFLFNLFVIYLHER